MKWCEIGLKKNLRNDTLVAFLQKNAVASEFQFIEATQENFKDKLTEAKSQFEVIRIHPALMHLASQTIDRSFQELVRMGTVDTLIKQQDKFWPESLLRESMFQFLTSKVKNMDVQQEALVIGACGVSRAVAAALIKLGFSQINITSDSVEKINEMADDFKKIYFNTHFKTTPKEELTLLPGVHGIVVNTFDFDESEDFLNDLYFFNFLKKGGWAIDFSDVPLETPFIHIAKDIEAHTVSGYEFNSFYDMIFVQKVFGKVLGVNDYKDHLKQDLEKATYDKDKYQKILTEFQV